MKNSIVFKTSFIIIIVLVVIMSIIGVYIQNSQAQIVSKLQENQKNYITNQLDRIEKEDISKEIKILNSLTESIAGALTDSLYNLDNDGIQSTFKNFLKRDNIKAIYLFDYLDNSIFMSGYKNTNKLVFAQELPKKFYLYDTLPKYNLMVDEENLGYIQVFYDNEKIINKIADLKEQDFNRFKQEIEEINEEIKLKKMYQIIAFLLAGILIILTIIILLKEFVNKPLHIFKDGLYSFFDYLENSNVKIKTIDINTKDEFGFMTKSVNESIQVSIKMHNDIYNLNANLEKRISDKTADLDKAKRNLEAINKHTRESIKYASLIQSALIPDEKSLLLFFKDYFVTWLPKDIVGGDIWLFSELRNKDECLIFYIDCTGHGVPGAFVTMIVKTIEREITSKIKKHPEFDISPALIMGYFNRNMKMLLKQETKDSLSNAGWDGGIIYYNKKEQILKFAGAETALFYMDNDHTLNVVKGNRYSVGYKRCEMDYEYKESIIKVEEGMKFYCTTDGYLDQNGGEKNFPFGKKNFTNIIRKNHTQSMAALKDIFMSELMAYESIIDNSERTDDITMICFEIGQNLHPSE